MENEQKESENAPGGFPAINPDTHAIGSSDPDIESKDVQRPPERKDVRISGGSTKQ